MIKVKTYIDDGNQFLEISVIDSGIGIKEEDQNKLFKLFGYIQDSQQMNIHGIGLGLTISKKIIEQFDGEIGLNSKEGEGSTFKFVLKLYDQNQLNLEQQVEIIQPENKVNYAINLDEFQFNWKPKRLV